MVYKLKSISSYVNLSEEIIGERRLPRSKVCAYCFQAKLFSIFNISFHDKACNPMLLAFNTTTKFIHNCADKGTFAPYTMEIFIELLISSCMVCSCWVKLLC